MAEKKTITFEWACRQCGEYNLSTDDECVHCTEVPDRTAARQDHARDLRKHER